MNNINAIKFISEGASTISLVKVSNPKDYSISLEYSYNGIDWSDWDLSALTLNSGDTLYIRGNNPDGFNSYDKDTRTYKYYKFRIEGDKVSCSGNIMSLIDYKNLPDVIPCSYCFYGLFENCSLLTTAPELPSTKLTDRCYSFMFSGCTSLVKAPDLPATELTESCYESMFSNCYSLTVKPELPATKLADYCYSWMFNGCTSLKDKK